MTPPGRKYRCACGEEVDCHHDVEGTNAQPVEGDALLCAHCGRVWIATEDNLRAPTNEERAEIDQRLREAAR